MNLRTDLLFGNAGSADVVAGAASASAVPATITGDWYARLNVTRVTRADMILRMANKAIERPEHGWCKVDWLGTNGYYIAGKLLEYPGLAPSADFVSDAHDVKARLDRIRRPANPSAIDTFVEVRMTDPAVAAAMEELRTTVAAFFADRQAHLAGRSVTSPGRDAPAASGQTQTTMPDVYTGTSKGQSRFNSMRPAQAAAQDADQWEALIERVVADNGPDNALTDSLSIVSRVPARAPEADSVAAKITLSWVLGLHKVDLTTAVCSLGDLIPYSIHGDARSVDSFIEMLAIHAAAQVFGPLFCTWHFMAGLKIFADPRSYNPEKDDGTIGPGQGPAYLARARSQWVADQPGAAMFRAIDERFQQVAQEAVGIATEKKERPGVINYVSDAHLKVMVESAKTLTAAGLYSVVDMFKALHGVSAGLPCYVPINVLKIVVRKLAVNKAGTKKMTNRVETSPVLHEWCAAYVKLFEPEKSHKAASKKSGDAEDVGACPDPSGSNATEGQPVAGSASASAAVYVFATSARQSVAGEQVAADKTAADAVLGQAEARKQLVRRTRKPRDGVVSGPPMPIDLFLARAAPAPIHTDPIAVPLPEDLVSVEHVSLSGVTCTEPSPHQPDVATSEPIVQDVPVQRESGPSAVHVPATHVITSDVAPACPPSLKRKRDEDDDADARSDGETGTVSNCRTAEGGRVSASAAKRRKTAQFNTMGYIKRLHSMLGEVFQMNAEFVEWVESKQETDE